MLRDPAQLALLLLVTVPLATARVSWRPLVDTMSATPNALATFLGTVRSIFGRASDFFHQQGYRYDDVYNDQLMFTSLNAYENEQQRIEETKQGDLLTQDLASDYSYFVAICILLSITTASLVILVVLRLHETYVVMLQRRRRRTIED